MEKLRYLLVPARNAVDWERNCFSFLLQTRTMYCFVSLDNKSLLVPYPRIDSFRRRLLHRSAIGRLVRYVVYRGVWSLVSKQLDYELEISIA